MVFIVYDYKIVCLVYFMLRDGKVCDVCLIGMVFNVFCYCCQEGFVMKSLLFFLEVIWQLIVRNYYMFDVIILLSEFLKGILRCKLLYLWIDVIVNGVDDDFVIDKIVDKGYLLYVGWFSCEKGVVILFLVYQKMCNCVLLKVVGYGLFYDELVVNYLDVEFLGYVQQGEVFNMLIKEVCVVIFFFECYENCFMLVLEVMFFVKLVIGLWIGGILE